MRAASIGTMVLMSLLVGCGRPVDRQMRITSEPEGALVFISDREAGRTPLTVPFTWYGDYDIYLRHEDYETLKTHANIKAPWHQLPPIDLLTAVSPWTVRDHRYLHFEMSPLVYDEDAELIRRAERLRERNLQPVDR